jgi:hypothetical protein
MQQHEIVAVTFDVGEGALLSNVHATGAVSLEALRPPANAGSSPLSRTWRTCRRRRWPSVTVDTAAQWWPSRTMCRCCVVGCAGRTS